MTGMHETRRGRVSKEGKTVGREGGIEARKEGVGEEGKEKGKTNIT